jgi:hypothetical protein
MANYPSSLYVQTDVAGTTFLSGDDHSARHNDIGEEIVAIETMLGTNSGGTSVLKDATAGKFAVFNSGGTLNAGVLGTPMVRGGTVGTAMIGTSTFQGGTVANALVGTSSIWGGTIGTALIGTSTITGGTIGTALVGTCTITGGTTNALDMRGYYCTPQSTTLAGTGGTSTLNMALTNEWRVTFGTANGTLALSNVTDGQKFIISLTQDAVGTRTMVWFDTIKWPAAGTPALTVTAAKRDTFGFIATSGTTFDGFIVGQNL